MSNDKQPIIPAHWEQRWSNDAVALLKPIINQIRYAFAERDYDVFLQLWEPGHNPKGSFVSMGIRPQRKQKNGNPHSILFAFGWFYEAAYRWPSGYIDAMADRAVEQYERFNNGEWPVAQIHTDDETLLRNANVSAPEARRTLSHKNNSAVAKLKPTQMPELDCRVSKLDDKMADAWGEDIAAASQKKKATKKELGQTDIWDLIEEEEEDPLS